MVRAGSRTAKTEVKELRGPTKKDEVMRNRRLTFVVAGLFVLPAFAAASQANDTMGGSFAVGPDGASPVISDGIGGSFAVGPDGGHPQ